METMTAFQRVWVDMLAEEQEKCREICEVRARIKNLAMDQLANKKLLRMPHGDIPEISYRYPWSGDRIWKASGIDAAGYLFGRVRERACVITSLHVILNELRGKENSHAYKD